MANKADLIRRNGRWYFNKAYPKDLWPVTGKSPFRKSLNTDSLETAIRARPEAERLYWAKVDELQAKQGGGKPRQLTEIESMGIVARWFREEDAERTAELEDSRSPLMDIDGALEELEELDIAAREAIAESNYHGVQPLADKLVQEAGFTFDPRPKASKRLMAALLRGRRELLLMERSRLLGDYLFIDDQGNDHGSFPARDDAEVLVHGQIAPSFIFGAWTDRMDLANYVQEQLDRISREELTTFVRPFDWRGLYR